MFLNWRGIVLGSAIVIFLCFSGYANDLYARAQPSYQFDKALEEVADCTSEENAPVCARPSVRELLSMKGGAEVMDALSDRITAQQCHYIGHVVGQQSFLKSRSIEGAIAQCNRTCDSACVHGIIGESFAQELGLGSPDDAPDFDLKHLSPAELREIGTKLCESPETCHGVGHALFQIFGEFEPGLAICRDVGTDTTELYCYQGLFMEYADVLYSRNMRPVADVEYPTLETLDSLCSLPTFEERRSCFRYFPRMVISTLEKNGSSPTQAMTRLREICASYEEKDDEIACVVGIGVYSSYALAANPQEAVRACERFTEPMDQSSCNLGQISVATQDRQPKVLAYCAAVSNQSLKASCFQAVFFFLNRLGVEMKGAELLCPNDSVCEAEVKNYLLDPIQQIREKYAS